MYRKSASSTLLFPKAVQMSTVISNRISIMPILRWKPYCLGLKQGFLFRNNINIIYTIFPCTYFCSKSRNRSVGIATGYGPDGLGSIPGSAIFFLLHSFQTGPEVHPVSCLVGSGDLSPGVKRMGREADHSPPPSVEVKNGQAIPPLPYMSSWHSDYLIKNRENFAFFHFFCCTYWQ
jgi:hypothetical protein